MEQHGPHMCVYEGLEGAVIGIVSDDDADGADDGAGDGDGADVGYDAADDGEGAVDECADGTAGCEYGCANSPDGSYTCTCPDGFTLSQNGFSCLGECTIRSSL